MNKGALLLTLLACWVFAQLPPDQQLPVETQREVDAELKRLDDLLSTANDKGEIELQIANTYAAAGRFSEAIRRLRKVVAANLGFDPSRDPDFAKLRDTAEFRSIMEEVRRQTPPVHNSRLVATLDARDVRPENIALDVKHNAFLLSNTARFELVRCSVAGSCVPFVVANSADGSYGLGLKMDRASDAVWATDNTPHAASLRCYDLETGKLRVTASIEGKHLFNDLTISSRGVVYVTDTAEGSVYQLPPGTTSLQRLAPQHPFTAANGIAISADETLLYVSTWGDGIDVIDLRSVAMTRRATPATMKIRRLAASVGDRIFEVSSVMPLIHTNDVGLAFIDGLYTTPGSLTAIQNGPMLPRIVEFRLSENGLRIVGMRVLERRNPAFDGITTGVVVRNYLYYVANPQTDARKGAQLRPLQVFSVPIAP